MRGIPDAPRERPCLDGQRHEGEAVDCLDPAVDAGYLCRHCLERVYPSTWPNQIRPSWSTLSPADERAASIVYM